MANRKGVSRRDFLKASAAGIAAFQVASGASADNTQRSGVGKEGRVYFHNKLMGEPYDLLGKRIVFTNWHFVRQGMFAWINEKGENVTVGGSEGPWGARFIRAEYPHGIRLVARKAKRTGPLFKVAEGETGFNFTTVIKDDGNYRAWAGNLYFESNDGMNWQRPKLDIGNLNEININLTGGTVFKDPKAPDAERYKWVGGGGISREDYERIKKERPESWSPQADRVDVKEIFTVSGATSPDGIHWTRLKEPLSVEHSDTHIVAYYDQRLDKYVIYTRNYSIWDRSPKGPDQFRMWWDVGRRSIGRTASDTFDRFPVSEVILEPSPDMAPSDLLYTNCRTAIPGAPDLHLMFPAVWRAAADDTTSILLASSIDGKVWNYLPGGPVFETGEFEEWDGGCIFAVPNLIELPNGDWALPYAGYIFPHKYPRGQWKIGTGYAIWPKGRMIALESADLGEFITVGFYPPGRKLKINAVTKRAGSIFVEVTDLDRRTIPGRSFADCNPIIGDKPWVDVTWKIGSDLGHSENAPIALRFKLDRAAIYGLEFE